MSTLMIEHFAVPTSARQARRIDAERARVADELADRTVWCASAPPDALHATRALQERAGDAAVEADDVVLLDVTALPRAAALRESDAHVVWHVDPGWKAPEEPALGVDAYLMTWSGPGSGGGQVDCVAAFIPAAGVLVVKEVASGPHPEPYDEMRWNSVLADVVHGDRGDTVGGMRHARPAVAVR